MLIQADTVKTIIQIAFFRSKPSDLPASETLVLFTAVAALLVASIMEASFSTDRAIVRAVMLICIYGLAIWVLLRIRSFQSRWRQTISALFGTTCIVQILTFIPSWFILASYGGLTEESVQWTAMIAVPFGIWNLFITAFILKDALEISGRIRAFLLAFGMSILVSLVVMLTYIMIFGDELANQL